MVTAIKIASFVPTAANERKSRDPAARGDGGMTTSIEMNYSPFNMIGVSDARRKLAPELRIAAWGGSMNLLWEFLQSPLYADFHKGAWYYLWTRVHCTIGDVLILLGAFWCVSLLLRTRCWVYRRPWHGAPFFVAFGLGYTIFSEWLNVSVRSSWDYASIMPVVGGIGLSPVIQWILILPFIVFQINRRMRRDA